VEGGGGLKLQCSVKDLKFSRKLLGSSPQDMRCTSVSPEVCTFSLSAMILRCELVSPPRQYTGLCLAPQGRESAAALSQGLLE